MKRVWASRKRMQRETHHRVYSSMESDAEDGRRAGFSSGLEGTKKVSPEPLPLHAVSYVDSSPSVYPNFRSTRRIMLQPLLTTSPSAATSYSRPLHPSCQLPTICSRDETLAIKGGLAWLRYDRSEG
eukprot:scaffold5267_cov90-Cylindrotheca_fusiformis.AAC.1